MLRQMMAMIIIALTCLLTIGIYIKYQPPRSQLEPIHFQAPLDYPVPVEPPIEEDPPPVVIPQAVLDTNDVNRKIKSVTCDAIRVTIWEGSFRFRLNGNLRYEKDRNFRMMVRSIFGRELDLGSNENQFWFWSRRNREPGLYFAKHEDYYKTRLKTPFNPVWMMRSLGIDPIDVENVEFIDEEDKDIMVVKRTQNASGKKIIVTTFVNRSTNKISGILTTDLDAKPLVSAEIKEYKSDFPKKVVYHWFEEDKVMEIELINPRMGGEANPELWVRPKIYPQIDMGVD